MIFSLKRILAKLIDLVLFFISGFFILTIFTLMLVLIFNDSIVNSQYLNEFVMNMPSEDIDAMIEYFDSYYALVMILGIFGSAVMLMFGYVYFGIIGKFTYGSLGKYAMQIRVVNIDDSRCISTGRFFLREPLIHIMFIGMISSFLSIFCMPLGVLGSIGYYTYIILFIVGFDFWNRYMSLKLL